MKLTAKQIYVFFKTDYYLTSLVCFFKIRGMFILIIMFNLLICFIKQTFYPINFFLIFTFDISHSNYIMQAMRYSLFVLLLNDFFNEI